VRTLLDLAFAEPLPEAPAPAAPPRGKNLLDLAFESPPGGAGSQSRTLLDAAFESPGIGTAAAPPGWSESDRAKAVELDRRAAEIKATMTPGQTADQIYGSLMQGIFDLPASALKAIGTADEYLRKKVGSWTTDEQATAAAGKAIEDFSREVFKTNPDLQNDFWLSKLPGMIGTLASFIVPATEMKFAVEGRAVGRAGAPITEIAKAAAARGAVAGTRAAAGIGAMTMAQGQFEAAKAAGADDDTAMKAYVGGLGIGATMAIPLHRWLSRINEGTNGGYAKVLKEVGTDGAVNFGVGFLQTTAGNAIAKELYDADRDILDNAVESGAVFSVAGLPFSLLSSAIRNAAAPGAKPPAPGPEAPPAPLPEIPTPPTKAPAPDIAAAVENLSKAVGALKATVAPQVPQEPPVEAAKSVPAGDISEGHIPSKTVFSAPPGPQNVSPSVPALRGPKSPVEPPQAPNVARAPPVEAPGRPPVVAEGVPKAIPQEVPPVSPVTQPAEAVAPGEPDYVTPGLAHEVELIRRWKGAGTVGQQAARLARGLRAAGVTFQRENAGTGSVYFRVELPEGESLSLRVADHAQPEHGGVRWSPALGMATRKGAADFSADPETGQTWRDLLKTAIERNAPASLASRAPESAVNIEGVPRGAEPSSRQAEAGVNLPESLGARQVESAAPAPVPPAKAKRLQRIAKRAAEAAPAQPAPGPAPEGKQPWEMTAQEFADFAIDGRVQRVSTALLGKDATVAQRLVGGVTIQGRAPKKAPRTPAEGMLLPDGTIRITDGSHRIAGAIARGEKDFPVRVRPAAGNRSDYAALAKLEPPPEPARPEAAAAPRGRGGLGNGTAATRRNL